MHQARLFGVLKLPRESSEVAGVIPILTRRTLELRRVKLCWALQLLRGICSLPTIGPFSIFLFKSVPLGTDE